MSVMEEMPIWLLLPLVVVAWVGYAVVVVVQHRREGRRW